MPKHHFLKPISTLLIALFFSYHSFVQAQALNKTPAQLVDEIVVVVNNSVITLQELNKRVQMIEHRLVSQHANLPPKEELNRQVLEQMVLDKIQQQKAEEEGIAVNEAEVNQAIERIAASNQLTVDAFRKRIENDGIEWSTFKKDAQVELTIAKLKQKEVDSKVTVSDAEVTRYLANQKKTEKIDNSTQPKTIQQTHVSHILIRVGDGVSEEQAQNKLKEIKQSIEKGESFSALARRYSQDGSAEKGGDLGWIDPGQTVPAFEQAMNNLKINEISEPIRTEYGYHLLLVLERREGKAIDPEREKVRQIIGERKSNQLYNDWLRELHDAAFIQYK